MVALLDSHSSVAMTNEAGWVTFLRKSFLLASTPSSREIDDGEGFRTPGILPEKYTEQIARSMLATMQPFVREFYGRAVQAFESCAFFGDKVLGVNDLEFAVRWFPDALFVQLVRDPRDVVASTYAFSRKQAMTWDDAEFRVRVEHMAHFLRESDRLLAGRQRLFVRYEDLIAALPMHAERVFAFLGLHIDPGVERFLASQADALFRRHGTSTSPQASIGRWARDYTDEQKQIAADALGAELARLGYPG